MPKVVRRTFQRHFPPLTNRSMFRKEPLSTVSPLTSRTEFPLTDSTLEQPVNTSVPVRHSVGGTNTLKTYIPKPHGEVSRLSRGGYNLEEALGWSKAEYNSVQVFRLSVEVVSAFNYSSTLQPLTERDPGDRKRSPGHDRHSERTG